MCREGYNGNGFNCTDVNECDNVRLNKCTQKCKNLNGTYACQCNNGYILANDNFTCNGKMFPFNV